MKKKISALMCMTLLLFICACGTEEVKPDNLENMSYINIGDSHAVISAIVWDDKTYVPFCVLNNEQMGDWIGIVNDDENDRVYEYDGYSADEWIISFYKTRLMDSPMLMRELQVTKIPNGLHSDYEWNN